jgi:tRNA pseudouridine55 synthase
LRHGLLLVDKPTGVTSHDIVDVVRRRLRERSAGHLGTLDPGASGLLVVALGAATRCATVWQGGDKTYAATLKLGVVTSTQDLHGEVLEERPVAAGEQDVRDASRAFVGAIQQLPPMMSAVKVGGQRLYRLARRGITIERAPRTVHVRSWEWTDFDLPLARFRIVCSSGTYVRTLAHDLGQRLGCGASLASLRRLRSEPFDVERAVSLRDLDTRPAADVWASAGLDLDGALAVLPRVTLDPDAVRSVARGGRPAVAYDPARAPLHAGPRSVVLAGADGAIALGELRPDPLDPARAIACPKVVFPWASGTETE